MGNLFVVATPIGNLKDITLRALETLKSVDFILAEDTRITFKLLSYYNIKKPILSYHKFSKEKTYEKIYKLLAEDKNLALVPDAGTPSISDPGSKLIQFLINKNPQIKIIPIPGPSALTAALSISGATDNQFTFLGYPPHQKGRSKFFEKLKVIEIWPIVLYESPHRLLKTLKDLKEVVGDDLKIIVCRELTKIYEEVWRGEIKSALNYFNQNKIKGEFVLILQK